MIEVEGSQVSEKGKLRRQAGERLKKLKDLTDKKKPAKRKPSPNVSIIPDLSPDQLSAQERKYFPSVPKWTDADVFIQTIEAYFEYCDTHMITKQVPHSKGITIVKTPIPYTMAGLARALGISRDALNRYKQQDSPLATTNPEAAQRMSDAIYTARDRIHENNLNMGLLGCHDAKISELNLLNNFGYSRKVELELPSGGEVNVVFSTDHTRQKLEAFERENIELKRKLAALEGTGLRLIESKQEEKANVS